MKAILTGRARRRRNSLRGAVLLAACATCAGAAGATVFPVEERVVLGPALEERVRLDRGWRYRPGDVPNGADPALEDRGWAIARSILRDPEDSPEGWPGIGWFRRRLALAEGMPATVVALRLEQAGAAEVYLDGRLVVRFGTVSTRREGERPLYPRDFVGVALEPGRAHVLAVRYSNFTGNVIGNGVRGFVVNLRGVEAAAAAYNRTTVAVTSQPMAFAGAFSAFALLHLLLFAFDRRRRENLAVALFATTQAAMYLVMTRYQLTADLLSALALFRPLVALQVAVVLTGLAAEHAVLRRRPAWTSWAIGAAGVALAAWVWTWSAFRSELPARVFVLLGFLEMLRVAVAAAARREPEAWIVAAGFAPIALVLAAEQVLALADAGSMPQTAVLACTLLLFAALSVFLSRRSARTAHELEARLAEVRALSERAIEQERRVAREEAERRLVEERHERRTRELEEARRIQLAMLPPDAPAVAGFDVAFRMVTATEVGGDYVDIRAGSGGSLLAVGDATSHGLQAGMVVAVAKSLFQAAGPEEGPAAVLRRVGAGLAALRERRASMALAVLHLAPGGLRFASAGMPPLLVARGGRPVEEMLLPGVPLGTLPGVEYEEAELALAPGDTVLAVSDGLVEAAASGAEAFGYERAAAALRALHGRTAREVADGVLAAVTAHLGDAPPPDDVTVVALVPR